jgi:SH3-like domain-containing protein
MRVNSQSMGISMTVPSLRTLTTALLALSAVAAFSRAAHADPVVPGEEHCVVNVRSDDILNMREAPNSGAYVVAQKRYGECGIRVSAECSGSWCPVEDGESEGWVHRRYIAMVSPALYCVSGVEPDDVLNVRAFPSAQSKIMDELAPNACEIAFLPYAVEGWQKVRAGDTEGWVRRIYLSGE